MNPRTDDLRQKLRHLSALHDSGALDTAAYEEARRGVERELSDQILGDPQADAPRVPRGLALGLALAVLVLAAVGYSVTGEPQYVLGKPGAPQAVAGGEPGGEPTPQQVDEMIQQLAERLKDRQDDLTGWTLLARAYAATGRTAEAVPAFRKALSLAGEDVGLMADLADVLTAQNNGSSDAEATKLVERALALDPNHLKSLALAGSAAYDRGEFAKAVQQWSALASRLPADSPILAQVQQSIAQAREAAGPGAALPPLGAGPAPAAVAAAAPPAATAGASATPAGAAATALSGQVRLSPSLAAQASPDDTVFVLARAAEGPRMPLAVLRRQVRDLPLSFTLDDSMAMAPGATISSRPKLVVVARVSKSGQAMPQPGDLAGESTVVAPGARDIAVEIREVVSQ